MCTALPFVTRQQTDRLDKLIQFGEGSLRNAVRQYLAHYHEDRPHQGLGNQLIMPTDDAIDVNAEVESTERLGGGFGPIDARPERCVSSLIVKDH